MAIRIEGQPDGSVEIMRTRDGRSRFVTIARFEREKQIYKNASERNWARVKELEADNARLREIVEYILRLWDGSLNARLPLLINWIDKAKTALREGR